jgi:hypothetical protein
MRDRKAFHFIAAIALFAAICSTQGCSVRYRFIIVNASDDEVTVVYSLRPEWTRVDGRGPQYTVERLLEISVAELRNREALWQSVPADRVSIDDAGGKVTVRLGASMALQVAEIFNYGGHDRDPGQFPLSSLDLEGARGEVHLTGEQVRYHFVSTDDHFYRLPYG